MTLNLTNLIGFGVRGAADIRLSSILSRLGYSPNLVLDAGDAASYSSGQKWLDVSGNGYDFFRGASASSEGSDPTFNGTPGGLSASEYWSFDASDFFRYDTTNETWMNALHQNNAAFTIGFAMYISGANDAYGFFGTASAGGSPTGVFMRTDSGTKPRFVCWNSGSPGRDVTAGTSFSTAAWNIFMISIDEAASSGFMYLNGAYNQVGGSDTFNASYSSPSAGAATYAMEIASTGNAVQPTFSGNRMGWFFALPVAVSKAQADGIWLATKGRYAL
jgi:hypothetical protein